MDLRATLVSAYAFELSRLSRKMLVSCKETSFCYTILMNRSDFNAVEAVVDATHRYPEMFYPKEQ